MNVQPSILFLCRSKELPDVSVHELEQWPERAACLAAKVWDQTDPTSQARKVIVHNTATGQRTTVRVEAYTMKHWRVER